MDRHDDHGHHHKQHGEVDRLAHHLDELTGEVRELETAMARHFVAGEFRQLRFTSKQLGWTDDVGSNALAYAVWNPNNFAVALGFAGADATPAGFVVPKQKLVVLPCQVNGAIRLAVAESEIGEGGSIFRVRFPTPQPFFVGALA